MLPIICDTKYTIMAKLRDELYRQLSECRVMETMSGNNHYLWGICKDGVVKACNKVCGYKDQTSNVNTWWWNSGVKDGIQREKVDRK